MEQLPLFFTVRGQSVLVIGSGDAAAAKRRLVESAGASAIANGLPTSGLAFLAIEDEDAARAGADALRAKGIRVNVVDKPWLCDFTVPAIVDRAPVTLAVGTAGASASLAKTLRERLEGLLPESLGALARSVHAARAQVASQLPTPAQRRRFWDALMAPGAPLDPMLDIADPDTAIIAGLANAQPAGSARIERIRLATDDPDALTLRQLRLLSQADAIVEPQGSRPRVLARARRDAMRYGALAELPPDFDGLCIEIEP